MKRWRVTGRWVATVVLCAAPALLTGCSSASQEVEVARAAGSPASTVAPVNTPSTTSSSALPAASTSSTHAPTRKAVVRASSTTTTVPASITSTTLQITTTTQCRNSHDPACGPYRWDPQPINDPMNVHLEVLTAKPRAGQTVEFRVVATDDGRIDRDCVGVSYGDDKDPWCAGSNPMCAAHPGAYGPWTPPEKPNDRFERVFPHVYDKPGTFVVSLIVRELQGCGSPPSPYGSTGQGSTSITVEP